MRYQRLQLGGSLVLYSLNEKEKERSVRQNSPTLGFFKGVFMPTHEGGSLDVYDWCFGYRRTRYELMIASLKYWLIGEWQL